MVPKRFRVAFSFTREKRVFVQKVAEVLGRCFGLERVLYDKFYEAQFAHADLAFDLPGLYKEADLVVAVLCRDYESNEWCGLEWRAIYSMLMAGDEEKKRVMLSRYQRVDGKGLHGLSGYVDLDDKRPHEFAVLILERLASNEGKERDFYTKLHAEHLVPPPASPSPALHSLIPNNLPRLLPFFGREKELGEIVKALDPASRSWGTLIDGDGGIGKTSLAVRAAYDCPPEHFERIVFVSLKKYVLDDHGLRSMGAFALTSWLEMLNEMARVLELPEVPKADEKQRARVLRDALAGRRILFVLDNLESLSEAEQEELFAFLDFLPGGCKALLTSRAFAGNKVLALDLKQLDEPTALRMLGEIAEHNAAFAKSSVEERIKLHQQTSGNALLLRWVAAQVGRGQCTGLVDALAFLSQCPPKDNPLRYIFEQVVESLSAAEVRILAALTWPAQPIPTEAIAEIAGVELAEARTALKILTNRSLVVPDQEEKEHALVPLVAEFLRLRKPEVVEEVGGRLEKRAYELIMENGGQKHERFPMLDAAWPSVAPALKLLLAGDNDRLQEVCGALQDFLNFTGRWDEWQALCQQAETRALAARDHRNAGWRAYQSGWVHRLRGQPEGILACAERATAHWQQAFPPGSPEQAGVRERSTSLQLRGIGYRLQGDYSAAIAAFRQVVEMLRSLAAESADVSSALNSLAEAERLSGDLDAAGRDYSEGLRVARAVAYAEGVATCTGNLALLALQQGNWVQTESLAREALPLAEKLGRQSLIASDCDCLAEALAQQDRGAEGLPYARRAVAIFTRLGSPKLARAQKTLGRCEQAIVPPAETEIGE